MSSQHTFRGFDAINAAFARWELSHFHVFRFGDRLIGTKAEDLDFEDDRRSKIAHRKKGEVFTFEFDFGDSWEHRCTMVDIEVEPEHEYGQRPRQPSAGGRSLTNMAVARPRVRASERSQHTGARTT